MSQPKVKPTQQSNGGHAGARSAEAITITQKEYGDLYLAFDTLPGSTIKKNLGTVLEENFVNRTWLSAQVGTFHRNARKLKPLFDELYAKQEAYVKQQRKLTADVLKYKTDVTKLADVTQQLRQLNDDWNEEMLKKVALPEIEKIPESLIKDWEIINPYVAAFWKYAVDFEK